MKMRITYSGTCLILALWTALSTFGADYQLHTLEKAEGLFQAATNAAMYTEAAEHYAYLVEEEGIRNGHLFYTLGNCWFMAGDTGRAILNYRRAEQYFPADADIQHNLKAARALRSDLIPEKERSPIMAHVLGWHFNSSTTLRWQLFTLCWLTLWSAWFWKRRTRRKEALITVITAGVLSAVLLASLLTESLHNMQSAPGVITAEEVLARKGDGDRYAPAFQEPLHSGTEFERLENRGAWWKIRLADGQTCWIPSRTADTIALSGK